MIWLAVIAAVAVGLAVRESRAEAAALRAARAEHDRFVARVDAVHARRRSS